MKKRKVTPKPAPAQPPAAVWLSPSKLKPWADNPRLNGTESVDRVAASIKRFGFGAPVVARAKTLEIIAGHTRWQAAQKLNLEAIPVRLLDISERDAHVLAVADNRHTELTGWQNAGLDKVLGSFDPDELGFTGFTQADIDKLNAHITNAGKSAELDIEGVTNVVHKCPQCGCEFK